MVSSLVMRSSLRRRTLLLGAPAALGTLALAPRLARAAGASVLVVGDSMIAGGFGLYLASALGKDGFDTHRFGKSSTGLARPDFFDWHAEAQRQVEATRPDATVVMFGGNDVQGLYMGKGRWIRWHEPGWSEEYARRVAALCNIVAPNGQRIFWVGMPVMRPAKFHARVQRVNTIYRAEMAIRPAATFVDTWPVLAGPDGGYADKIPVVVGRDEQGEPIRKLRRVRAGDGIHLSRTGAHVLKDHVRAIVTEVLRKQA